jgi:hypothetical protein
LELTKTHSKTTEDSTSVDQGPFEEDEMLDEEDDGDFDDGSEVPVDVLIARMTGAAMDVSRELYKDDSEGNLILNSAVEDVEMDPFEGVEVPVMLGRGQRARKDNKQYNDTKWERS